MCNKIAYTTKSTAKAAAKQLVFERRLNSSRQRKQKDPKKLRPYRCPGCGLWHLTVMNANSARTHRSSRAHKQAPSLSGAWIEARVRAQIPEIAAAIAQSIEVNP